MIRAELLNIILRDEEELSVMLDSDTRGWMADSLEDFCRKASKKFLAGQKEHGGSIFNRDLKYEIELERIDSFWYGKADERNQQLNAIESLR